MVGTIQTSASPWHLNNQRSLVGAIAQMRTALETDLAETTESWHSSYLTEASPVTLNALSQIFHLSRFEQCLLLLCAGMELDGQWGTLCAAAQGDPQRPFPTLSLALSFLPEPCWQALAPQAALRHWRLIEIGHGNALTTSPLRIDEQILHYLTGTPSQDSRLAGFVEPMSLEMDLVPSHQQIVSQITAYWMQAAAVQPTPGLLPVIQLWGEDSLSKQAIASQTCQELDLQIIKLSAEVLPTDISQIILIKEICEREYLLNNTAILLDCDYLENTDGTREHAIARFIESIQVPLIVMGRDRRPQRQRALLPIQINAPTLEEQRVLWRKALNSPHELTNGEYPETIQGDDKDHSSARSTNQFIDDPIDTLVSYFNLSSSSIHAISLQDRTPLTSDTALSHSLLWQACRVQARPRLDELAQRIQSAADWEDLILPEKEQQVLAEIVAHVRQRIQVYDRWGFGKKSKRGLGISALFAGASGTGKTMAAEVLGQALQLDVYRIDLSSVVSKYIGETEKNLRRIFDAAEGGGVILLFDEADALFGKRSEVKDARDRYANVEVGYLLQRMEAYRGLAILTTNLKSSLDQAFLRRIRFVVQFPFPDATQRAEIWRRAFPSETPTEALDYERLAKLNVAGGNIRNIALNAAFIAADAQEPVRMTHLLQAAKCEYLKLERPLTDSEIKGWVPNLSQ